MSDIDGEVLEAVRNICQSEPEDLGRAGECRVFAGRFNKRGDTEVTIYVPGRSVTDDAKALKRIGEEFDRLDTHNSKAIARPLTVLRSGANKRCPVLVMHREQRTLIDIEPATLSVDQRLDLVERLLVGVQDLHALGIVHGGLRPAAIEIQQIDNENWPRIAGIPLPSASPRGEYPNDPQFCTRVDSSAAPTTGDDIASVGMLAYDLLLGSERLGEAFHGNAAWGRDAQKWLSWHSDAKDVPRLDELLPEDQMSPVLAGVIERMVRSSPRRSGGYGDAAKALTALRMARDDATGIDIDDIEDNGHTRWARPRPAVLVAAGVAIVVLAAAGVWKFRDHQAEVAAETVCANARSTFLTVYEKTVGDPPFQIRTRDTDSLKAAQATYNDRRTAAQANRNWREMAQACGETLRLTALAEPQALALAAERRSVDRRGAALAAGVAGDAPAVLTGDEHAGRGKSALADSSFGVAANAYDMAAAQYEEARIELLHNLALAARQQAQDLLERGAQLGVGADDPDLAAAGALVAEADALVEATGFVTAAEKFHEAVAILVILVDARSKVLATEARASAQGDRMRAGALAAAVRSALRDSAAAEPGGEATTAAEAAEAALQRAEADLQAGEQAFREERFAAAGEMFSGASEGFAIAAIEWHRTSAIAERGNAARARSGLLRYATGPDDVVVVEGDRRLESAREDFVAERFEPSAALFRGVAALFSETALERATQRAEEARENASGSRALAVRLSAAAADLAEGNGKFADAARAFAAGEFDAAEQGFAAARQAFLVVAAGVAEQALSQWREALESVVSLTGVDLTGEHAAQAGQAREFAAAGASAAAQGAVAAAATAFADGLDVYRVLTAGLVADSLDAQRVERDRMRNWLPGPPPADLAATERQLDERASRFRPSNAQDAQQGPALVRDATAVTTAYRNLLRDEATGLKQRVDGLRAAIEAAGPTWKTRLEGLQDAYVAGVAALQGREAETAIEKLRDLERRYAEMHVEVTRQAELCGKDKLGLDFTYVAPQKDAVAGGDALARYVAEHAAGDGASTVGEFCILKRPLQVSDVEAALRDQSSADAARIREDLRVGRPAEGGRLQYISLDAGVAFAAWLSRRTGKAICVPTAEHSLAAISRLGSDFLFDSRPEGPYGEWTGTPCKATADLTGAEQLIMVLGHPDGGPGSGCELQFARMRGIGLRLVRSDSCSK